MALEPLATVADLSAYGVDAANETLATRVLASVSEAVREAAGAPISRVTSTVVLTGSPGQWLRLPGGPVRSVATVLVDGKAVTDYKVRDGRLWLPSSWQPGGEPSEVTVTYDHGLDEVPEDIVRLVCMYTAAGMAQAASGFDSRGKAYERIDDWQVGYLQGGDEVVDHAELTDRTKASLAARFGGGTYVTGDY